MNAARGIHELALPVSPRVRRLFEPVDFHVSCAAVLTGSNPGRVFVDDPQDPTAGFVVSPEAAYLSGDADASGFCAGLAAFLPDPGNLGFAIWRIVVVASRDGWVERLGEIAGDSGVARDVRRHYVCEPGRGAHPLAPPPGASLRLIDGRFLEGGEFVVPDHLAGWVRHNWGSRDHFLRVGFGVATVCAGEVVAWSVADCVCEGVL